ncbi:hypothetical protein NUU61_009754 [Penicillium alfredii]|uniref:RING-type domain-containing protein n=1 Tax=Penicillium alfredii TaxID=1506179 RepID=A0A9W9EGV8_9EURO|nr:uncharacterized protein NUU61_009754 [Penicillium alfredii]KAJ5081490.1 hypothetical protein NUU61_009754 [Penicillium alfredii]
MGQAIPPTASGSVAPCASRATRQELRSTNTTGHATTPINQSRKRKAQSTPTSKNAEVIDLTSDEPPSAAKKAKHRQTKHTKQPDAYIIPEQRARRFRHHPPQTYLARLARVRTQRMFIVGHTVGGTEEVPEISFDIIGSTGNLYKTIIGKVPTCDCPDSRKGNQCKHICYGMIFFPFIPIKTYYFYCRALAHGISSPCPCSQGSRSSPVPTGFPVLGKPFEYPSIAKAWPQQLESNTFAFKQELREMYEKSSLSRNQDISTEDNGGNRKPIDGECPICFMEFEADEAIVWCKAACGNNIHKTCFSQWAAKSPTCGVRCVYCRATWKFDSPTLNLESLRNAESPSEEGYINVAEQFGLSGERGTEPSL